MLVMTFSNRILICVSSERYHRLGVLEKWSNLGARRNNLIVLPSKEEAYVYISL